MLDKNGNQLKVGMIVKIEGGFFKNDNGIFRIANTPEDENWIGSDCCLKRVNTQTYNYSDSKSKYSTAFFPLMVTVSNREKRQEAREHNKNATIEIIGAVRMYKVREKQYPWVSVANNFYYVTDAELAKLKEYKKMNEGFEFEILEVLNSLNLSK
jgi:hypothetical protein